MYVSIYLGNESRVVNFIKVYITFVTYKQGIYLISSEICKKKRISVLFVPISRFNLLFNDLVISNFQFVGNSYQFDAIFVIFSGLCSQEEERLVRDLFRGYNKLIRPVQNMTQKVDVAFGLAFIQLINVVIT